MIAKRKGVVARLGLKEAWCKGTGRRTRIGFEAGGIGRVCWKHEVHIHQRFRMYIRRSRGRHELTSGDLMSVRIRTEGRAIDPERTSEVSRGRIGGTQQLKARTVPARV